MKISGVRAAAFIVIGGLLVMPGIVVIGINNCLCPGGLEWLFIPGGILLIIGLGMVVYLSTFAYQEGRKAGFRSKS